MKRLFLPTFAMLVFSIPVLASTENEKAQPKSVELFTTHSQLSQTLDVKRSASGLSVFILDDAKRLEKSANDNIPKPTKAELNAKDGIEQYKARIKPYIIETAKQQKTQLVQSWSGVEKAIRYQIDRVPAVVIDGEYILYGMPVSMAVYRWRTLKERGVIE